MSSEPAENSDLATPVQNSVKSEERQSPNGLSSNDSPMLSADHPRKRSKVSRACDACRRKKIRCDAEYLSSLQKVTKVCTNCGKNNESCSFSRTPLKRGPSKGYIKDLEDKLDEPKPRSKSLSIDAGSVSRPSLVLFKSLPFPPANPSILVQHHGSSKSNGHSPIVLPPLLNQSQSPLKLNVLPNVKNVRSLSESNPSSPRNSIAGDKSAKTYSPPIQGGPFWKVPYEMPGNPMPSLNDSTRRSSVDSLSSVSSGSRLPSLKPSNSITSDIISDSDDDFHSVKSSQSLSPRNSISSLSSLSGRINKNLNLHQYPQPPPQNHYQFSNVYYPQQQIQPQVLFSPHSRIPINSVNYNLQNYYTKFHPTFPILPFNQQTICNIVESIYIDESSKRFVELFNLSLNNLNYYQHQNINDNIDLLHKILALYPFKQLNTKYNENTLLLFFSSLVLINYAILLNGDIYSLGLSLSVAIFNDFKVLENFKNLAKEQPPMDHDSFLLYLPKLYYCIYLFDQCYSLSYGIQPITSPLCRILTENMNVFLPANDGAFSNFKLGILISRLIGLKNDILFNTDFSKTTSQAWNELVSSIQSFGASSTSMMSKDSYSKLFVCLIKDKFEVIDHLIEVTTFLKVKVKLDDDSSEVLRDDQFKLLRLVKKLGQSVISLANFISTVNLSNQNKNENINTELINPFINLGYGQSYKLIKLSKLIVDSILKYIDDAELVNRSIKINNELSIAYNLLSSNLKSMTSESSEPNNNTAHLQEVNKSGLGSVAVSLLREKIENYDLSFDVTQFDKQTGNEIESWKTEFFQAILPFVDRENSEGWF